MSDRVLGFISAQADRRTEGVARSVPSRAKQLIRPFTTVARPCRKDWLFVRKEALVSLAASAPSARGPTAPSALADPGLVLVRGPDRPDL